MTKIFSWSDSSHTISGQFAPTVFQQNIKQVGIAVATKLQRWCTGMSNWGRKSVLSCTLRAVTRKKGCFLAAIRETCGKVSPLSQFQICPSSMWLLLKENTQNLTLPESGRWWTVSFLSFHSPCRFRNTHISSGTTQRSYNSLL